MKCALCDSEANTIGDLCRICASDQYDDSWMDELPDEEED